MSLGRDFGIGACAVKADARKRRKKCVRLGAPDWYCRYNHRLILSAARALGEKNTTTPKNTQGARSTAMAIRHFLKLADFSRDELNHMLQRALWIKSQLKAGIQERTREFNALNLRILEQLLAPVALRSDITKSEVIETFQQFQDFINAKYAMTGIDRQGFEAHEARRKKALNILLYGVIAREETTHV